MKPHKVVMIGMGNIGRRHLQGLWMSDPQAHFYCYDSHGPAAQALTDFCANEGITAPISWCGTMEDARRQIDNQTVVVDATTTEQRHARLIDIIQSGPKAVITEKPVCLDLNQYQHLIDESARCHVPVYVDFVRRSFAGYGRIKERLKNSGPVHINFITGGVGLAASGIHLMDLAVFLLDAREYHLIYAQAYEAFHSKRPGYDDCYGELIFTINGQHHVAIKCLPDAQSSNDITTKDINIKIWENDGAQGTVVFFNAKEGVPLIEPMDHPFTSQISAQAYRAVRGDQKVLLPDLAESLMAHRMMRDFLDRTGLSSLRVT